MSEAAEVQAAIERLRAARFKTIAGQVVIKEADLTLILSLLDRAGEVLRPFAETVEQDISPDEWDSDFFRQGDRQYMRAPPIVVGDLRAASNLYQMLVK